MTFLSYLKNIYMLLLYYTLPCFEKSLCDGGGSRSNTSPTCYFTQNLKTINNK